MNIQKLKTGGAQRMWGIIMEFHGKGFGKHRMLNKFICTLIYSIWCKLDTEIRFIPWTKKDSQGNYTAIYGIFIFIFKKKSLKYQELFLCLN
jgi:hypothetical protein